MPILQITEHTVFKALPLDSTRLPANQKVSVSQGLSLPIQSSQVKGRHYFVQLQQELAPVGRSGYFYRDHVRIEADAPNRSTSAPFANRGVWITNVDSKVLLSHQTIKAAVQHLSELRFNTLYPVVWNRGHTLYPSQVAATAIGCSCQPNFQGRDMLAELIHEAKANGFRVIPWFEYGLMAPVHSAIVQQHPDWLTQTAQGEIQDQNSQVWLNPAHPEVGHFIVNLITEVVQQYDVDGVQLDDHFGLPVQMGYDALTQQLYRQENGTPAPSPYDVNWMTWRANQVTRLISEISRAVKILKPSCLISLSPNPHSFSYRNYLADWQQWQMSGLLDELVVQLYRDNLLAFERELNQPALKAAQQQIPVSIGILTGLKTKPVEFARIQQQVNAVRRKGFSGVCFFFYETVIHQTLTPQKISRNPLELQRLFPNF
jgi:uncharacterized lipoprotein YddW (UPF0748 family)